MRVIDCLGHIDVIRKQLKKCPEYPCRNTMLGDRLYGNKQGGWASKAIMASYHTARLDLTLLWQSRMTNAKSSSIQTISHAQSVLGEDQCPTHRQPATKNGSRQFICKLRYAAKGICSWNLWNLRFHHILFQEWTHFLILAGSVFYQMWLGS